MARLEKIHLTRARFGASNRVHGGFRAMQNFQVKGVQHLGKRAWIIVRHEAGSEPIEIGLTFSDPERALVEANRMNLYARERRRPQGGSDLAIP
jgi:hypothetical protein